MKSKPYCLQEDHKRMVRITMEPVTLITVWSCHVRQQQRLPAPSLFRVLAGTPRFAIGAFFQCFFLCVVHVIPDRRQKFSRILNGTEMLFCMAASFTAECNHGLVPMDTVSLHLFLKWCRELPGMKRRSLA